jgi:neurotransmitter-gated ion-channel
MGARARALLLLSTALTSLIASTVLSGFASAASQDPEKSIVRPMDAPPPTEGPIRVEVGLAVTNLAEVDEAHEQFGLSGFIVAVWDDSRLVFDPRSRGQVRFYRKDEIWTPEFQMLNAITPRSGLATISVSPSGRVAYVERFTVTLSAKFHLQRFPFDSQNLQIVIASFGSGATRLDLMANNAVTQLLPGHFLELEQWKLAGITTLTRTEMIGQILPVEQIEFSLLASRRPGFYIWTIMLPLSVMLVVSWSVLWIAPANFGQQLGIAMPTFLSVIAFSYAMGFTLPRVPYLTFINAFFLTIYLFVFLTVLETVAIYAIGRSEKKDTAAALHRKGRWFLPVVFLVTIAVIVSAFFVFTQPSGRS